MGIKTVYIIPEYPRPCQSPEDFIFESEDSLSTLWIQNIGQVSRTLGFRVLSSEFWVPSLLPAWASLNQHLSESKTQPKPTRPTKDNGQPEECQLAENFAFVSAFCDFNLKFQPEFARSACSMGSN